MRVFHSIGAMLKLPHVSPLWRSEVLAADCRGRTLGLCPGKPANSYGNPDLNDLLISMRPVIFEGLAWRVAVSHLVVRWLDYTRKKTLPLRSSSA